MNWFKMVCAGCCVATAGAANAALFHDDFNDGNAASRWGVVSQQEGEVGPDGSVDFNFDYSTLGIANPNGGSDTTGAFLQFNKNDDGPVNEGESYSIFPNGFNISGDFLLTVDMFVYNDGGSGTTEHGMVGVFLDNADPVSPYEFGSEKGPLAWVYSGEGGDGTGDLGSYAVDFAGAVGYEALGDYATLATLPPGFEATLGPASASSLNGAWVKVAVHSHGGTIDYLLNGFVVDSYDNTGGTYTAGNIFIGGMDVFNSANGANGVIIDNVQVVPEPWSAVLLIGSITMTAVYRRRA